MIIGITGNIGSGKSTVGRYIRSQGYPVLDADQISRELYQPSTNCYQEIVKHFSENILNSEREIDRSKLASIIFQNEHERKWLEKIVHAQILSVLQSRSSELLQTNKIVFWEVPLLFEAGWNVYVDLIMYVYADLNERLTRVIQRDQTTADTIHKRIQLQQDHRSSLRDIDILINNDSGIDELYHRVDDVLTQITQ